MGSGEEVTLETGDIDWGADDEANAAEIDFDISIKDSGITIESSGMEGGVAKNYEALSVLDSPNHREQFLDELFEVKFEKIQRDFFSYQQLSKLMNGCLLSLKCCSWKLS